MSEETKRLTLPFLEIEEKHIPAQTEQFVKMLAAYTARQGEDETGLALFNLRDAAKYQRETYQRIESILARLDKQEAAPQNESRPVTPETLRKLNDLYYNRRGGDLDNMEAYYSALEDARQQARAFGLTVILAENRDPDYTLYMTHALVPDTKPYTDEEIRHARELQERGITEITDLVVKGLENE